MPLSSLASQLYGRIIVRIDPGAGLLMMVNNDGREVRCLPGGLAGFSVDLEGRDLALRSHESKHTARRRS